MHFRRTLGDRSAARDPLTCMFSSGFGVHNQNSATTSGNALAPTFLTCTRWLSYCHGMSDLPAIPVAWVLTPSFLTGPFRSRRRPRSGSGRALASRRLRAARCGWHSSPTTCATTRRCTWCSEPTARLRRSSVPTPTMTWCSVRCAASCPSIAPAARGPSSGSATRCSARCSASTTGCGRSCSTRRTRPPPGRSSAPGGTGRRRQRYGRGSAPSLAPCRRSPARRCQRSRCPSGCWRRRHCPAWPPTAWRGCARSRGRRSTGGSTRRGSRRWNTATRSLSCRSCPASGRCTRR